MATNRSGGVTNVSVLIKNGYVVTVDPSRRVFDGGFVMVGEDGRIAAVGPGNEAPTGASEVIDATGMIVIPGLMNLHQHTWMNLFKGLADGWLLEPWVFGLVQPSIEAMTYEDILVSSRLAALEMLRTGTTTVLNHDVGFSVPSYEDAFIEPLATSGIRQVFARLFQCRTAKRPNYPSAAEAAAEFGRLVERYHGANGGLTRLGIVIECNAHHTELGKSSDELVRAGHDVARQHDLRVVVHMSGGTLSLDMGFTKYLRLTGRRDVAYLEGLGVLDHRWILKHGIHFSDTDIATARARGCHAVYTPTSESMRGGGLGPWRALHRSGVNCALGTDGPAVDYSVDMVEQMKACIYLQNVKHLDPAVMTPERVLEMATINAAHALGLHDELGSLEPGKRGDIAVFDIRDVHMQVAHNPLYSFICCARGADADTVIVDGRVVLKKRRFTGDIDVESIIAAATASGRRIAEQTGLIQRARPAWPTRRAAAN
jgi:5-methylthioadenosine/S-adenosylhomocysteine deaminase